MTGSAEKKDELYYLTLKYNDLHVNFAHTHTHTPVLATNVSLCDRSIWHFRLGNLSQNKLLYLHSKFPFIIINNKDVCIVCHYARQRKLSYNVSKSTAARPYDMIHFDIWGPLVSNIYMVMHIS